MDLFEPTIQKTHEWIRDLQHELRWEEPRRAYLALRLVLHALRDRLTTEEAVHLGAQLPMLVRGFYYEGWNPNKQRKARTPEEFFESISIGFGRNLPGGKPVEAVVRAVFRVLDRHVSAGEIEDIRRILPPQIRDLWPAKAA